MWVIPCHLALNLLRKLLLREFSHPLAKNFVILVPLPVVSSSQYCDFGTLKPIPSSESHCRCQIRPKLPHVLSSRPSLSILTSKAELVDHTLEYSFQLLPISKVSGYLSVDCTALDSLAVLLELPNTISPIPKLSSFPGTTVPKTKLTPLCCHFQI